MTYVLHLVLNNYRAVLYWVVVYIFEITIQDLYIIIFKIPRF